MCDFRSKPTFNHPFWYIKKKRKRKKKKDEGYGLGKRKERERGDSNLCDIGDIDQSQRHNVCISLSFTYIVTL